MLFVRGVHHFNVTVSLSPFSLVLVPAMCKSPTQHKHNIDIFYLFRRLRTQNTNKEPIELSSLYLTSQLQLGRTRST